MSNQFANIKSIKDAKQLSVFGIFLKEFFRLFGRHVIGRGPRVFFFRLSGIKVGKNTQLNGALQIMDANYKGIIEIGSYCAISPRVSLVAGSAPPFPHPDLPIESYPIKFGKIIIEDGVWIGTGAVILPGVTIGKHAIIGSNAVVHRNVPPYAIMFGLPAKRIAWRNIKGERVLETIKKV
jgi:acetyltransferase-like isoleucine patch superfamily enzyme